MTDEPGFTAAECANGHLSLQAPLLPVLWRPGDGDSRPRRRDRRGGDWTTSHATPPGVREPNTLAIAEFVVDGEPVRVLGGTTTDAVQLGDRVEPVYVLELREPTAGIREAASQAWDGYRFEPLE